MADRRKNRYSQLIEVVFSKRYEKGLDRVAFERSDIIEAARQLALELPKNISDVLYSFRYRTELPESIVAQAPEGKEWVIRPAGRARYEFALVSAAAIAPSRMLAETKIPDATPGVIEKYAMNDEQALLAKIRYNRLIDIFTGLACYSLQNHLRTTVPHVGQVEIDEIYVGIDKRGAHYVLPVEAKAASDKLGVIQIEQAFGVCDSKFPELIARPIAAQVFGEDVIALFEFERDRSEVAIVAEKHYRLVPPEALSSEELITYRDRPH